MRGEYRLRQCAGFEQGETEDNGIGCKGEYRAVQIVRYYHVVYQNRVNADAYHNPLCITGMKILHREKPFQELEKILFVNYIRKLKIRKSMNS